MNSFNVFIFLQNIIFNRKLHFVNLLGNVSAYDSKNMEFGFMYNDLFIIKHVKYEFTFFLEDKKILFEIFIFQNELPCIKKFSSERSLRLRLEKTKLEI